jgi:hypothetical protein
MCVNDLIVQGAEPLFFSTISRPVASTRASPRPWSPAMPMAAARRLRADRWRDGRDAGMYATATYDLAGFCVGAVERADVLTGQAVADGDVILGLASSASIPTAIRWSAGSLRTAAGGSTPGLVRSGDAADRRDCWRPPSSM